MKRKVSKLYTTRSIKKDKKDKEQTQKKKKMLLRKTKKILYVQVKRKNVKS